VIAVLALLALAHAPAPLHPAVAGMYVIDQMEMGGALELQQSGHFRYQFDYGAVSESADGDWTFDGKTVRLTSNPMPKLPGFIVERDDPAPAGELYVAVDNPDMSWSPLTVELTVEGFRQPVMAYAEDDGRVKAPEGRRITSVKMLMPVYETGDDAVALGGTAGHRLLFKPVANDIGKAAFHSEPLTVKGSSLIMHRYDADIIFRRAQP
jgi:hypothetical protein